MSEFLRAAKAKLQAAIHDIEARIAELHAEEAELRATRQSLHVVVFGEGARPATDAEAAESASRVLEKRRGLMTALAARPTASVPPPASPPTGIKHVDAASRIDAVLAKAGASGARYLDLARASKLGHASAKRLVAQLVTIGRVTKTGKTAATRFFLPTGRTARTAAAAKNGKGSPADDDSHGATVRDTSASRSAGVSAAPMDDNHPPADPHGPRRTS